MVCPVDASYVLVDSSKSSSTNDFSNTVSLKCMVFEFSKTLHIVSRREPSKEITVPVFALKSMQAEEYAEIIELLTMRVPPE